MKTSTAIGTSFVLLIVSSLTLYFGKLTLDKLDAEQWGMVVLGAGVTTLCFAILVACVKAITREDERDDEE